MDVGIQKAHPPELAAEWQSSHEPHTEEERCERKRGLSEVLAIGELAADPGSLGMPTKATSADTGDANGGAYDPQSHLATLPKLLSDLREDHLLSDCMIPDRPHYTRSTAMSVDSPRAAVLVSSIPGRRPEDRS